MNQTIFSYAADAVEHLRDTGPVRVYTKTQAENVIRKAREEGLGVGGFRICSQNDPEPHFLVEEL